jgi:hypothetical protein
MNESRTLPAWRRQVSSTQGFGMSCYLTLRGGLVCHFCFLRQTQDKLWLIALRGGLSRLIGASLPEADRPTRGG